MNGEDKFFLAIGVLISTVVVCFILTVGIWSYATREYMAPESCRAMCLTSGGVSHFDAKSCTCVTGTRKAAEKP